MQLVDADKLVKEFSKRVEMYKDERSFSKAAEARAARCIVRTAHTVDAVEVVRCKDCHHLLKDNSDRKVHLCVRERFARQTSLEDYCSYGERKESERNEDTENGECCPEA